MTSLALVVCTIETLFAEPPQTCGPNAWWHWQGPNVTRYGITRDLEAMKAAGLSGATVFTIQDVGFDCPVRLKTPVTPSMTFQSETWWEMLRFAVGEAKRLGLELGLHNCAGYSCSGGEWIKPENAMKKLVWTKGDGPIETNLGFYRDIARVETTNGVYRFGYTCTGKCCHPPPPGQEKTCLEADKMSAKAIALHLDHVLGGLKDHGITPSSPGLRFILMDSYEAGWNDNWTDDLVDEFVRRRGYDPIPFLPVLAGLGTAAGAERDAAFREDMWLTCCELKHERHYRQFRERLNAAGFEFHLEPYSGPFDSFEAAVWCDLAMNEFWEGLPFWTRERAFGGNGWMVGAVSRALGREIVGAEAFTGYPLDDPFAITPRELKAHFDSSMAKGLNRLSLHHWCHQPLDARWQPGFSMGPWGTHFGENATWFEPGKSFYRYMQRVQALLQAGRARTQALGVRYENADDPTLDALPYSLFLSDVELTDDHRVRVKRSGRVYPLLVTDPEWLKRPPKHLLERQVRARVEALEKAGVPVCRDGNYRAALDRLGEPPFFRLLEGATPSEVVAIAREEGERSYFFVANLTKSPRTIRAKFRPATGSDATYELWYPETGRKCAATGDTLALDAEESVFVVFGARSDDLRPPLDADESRSVPLGEWTVSFPEGAAAKGLFDWSKSDDEAIRYCSGTAVYRTTVAAKGRFILSLGTVRDIAEVFVNGRRQGVAWHDPFRLEVELPEERNLLEVKVTNSWTNRLIGDERYPDDCELPAEEVCFHPSESWVPKTIPIGRPVVAYPSCVLDNSPRKVARRAFSSWRYRLTEKDLRPSGLLGPVALAPVR